MSHVLRLAFKSIQPCLLQEMFLPMQLHSDPTTWIMDDLSGRPQCVRVDNYASEVVISNTSAPQGTVRASFLFTLYTSDFWFNSGSCLLQIISDSSIVGFISKNNEEEYRGLIESVITWCNNNRLKPKTKELVVDYFLPEEQEALCPSYHPGGRKWRE